MWPKTVQINWEQVEAPVIGKMNQFQWELGYSKTLKAEEQPEAQFEVLVLAGLL